jgi:hypothetical protein
MIVRLTAGEIYDCIQERDRRIAYRASKGWGSHAISADALEREFVGVCGECVVGKTIGLPIPRSHGLDGGIDFRTAAGTVDVKTPIKFAGAHPGNLLFAQKPKKTKLRADWAVLVDRYDSCTFGPIGCITLPDWRKRAELVELPTPTLLVSRADLLPYKVFLDAVAAAASYSATR